MKGNGLISGKDTEIRSAKPQKRFYISVYPRGNSPIKFNGFIFTVDTYMMEGEEGGFDADCRRWGGSYWWQNTRMPYWSMLLSGDFDLMQPIFKMYMNALPLRKFATSKYYNHSGAFYPETIYPWGTYTDNNYGRARTTKPLGLIDNKYLRYNWQSGLELSLMMLDYYKMTLDETFLREAALPFVSEIITFYNQHWGRDTKFKKPGTLCNFSIQELWYRKAKSGNGKAYL